MVGLSMTKPSPPPSFLVRRVYDMDTQQDEEQNLSKGGGAPREPTAIHIYCPTVSADVLLQFGYFLLGGWWQNLHFGHRKTLNSAKHTKSKKKSEIPLHGSTSCAASLRRAAHRMTGLGQSLRDPKSLMGGKPRGNLPGSDCGRVCQGGAEVSSTRRRSPWVNLRRSLRLVAWNVPSLRG